VGSPGDRPDAFDSSDLMRCARQLTEQAQLYADLSTTLLKEAARLRALAEHAGGGAGSFDAAAGFADGASHDSVPAILITDDGAERELFARELRSEGYEVRTATSTDEAWRETGTRHFDALILSLNGPATDALAFVRLLRSSGHEAPVAVIAAEDSLDDTTTSELQNLDAELRLKPFSAEDIVDLADWLVRQRVM
jgi:CheY-like chemotaxis protein